MARNTKGQITGTKPVAIALKKRLIEIANDEGIKLKAMVRDQLETELRFNVYDSYRPATKGGTEIKEYNETHKHQKANLYHHTGRLASSIYARIDGDTIKAMIKDEKYPDGASTTEVYDYLKFGTSKKSEKKGYFYNNGNDFSPYISQEPHNFEARTRQNMNQYLDDLAADIEVNGAKHINPKYLRKIRKSDM